MKALRIIWRIFVGILAVIGAATVSLFTFLKVTKYYEISINVNESTIALFDERVELLRTCGAYSADSEFIDITHVQELQANYPGSHQRDNPQLPGGK